MRKARVGTLCVCTISNQLFSVAVVNALQEHVTCAADVLIAPASTAELSSAIKSVRARAESEGRPLKMRPARNGFATMSSFACAAQPTLTSPFTVKGKSPLVAG